MPLGLPHGAPRHSGGGPAAVLSGLGSALPSRKVTNDELSERLDTSDAWIRQRTGVEQRFWVDGGQSTGDLAVEAGRKALESAVGEARVRVDTLIVATTTPDYRCPATAPAVAARLGLGNIAAFDVSAVCSGFVYALSVGASLITSGQSAHALVIGADTYSTILDHTDRSTVVIFGDGAGAVLLSRGSRGDAGAFFGFDLGSDGHHVSQRVLNKIRERQEGAS